VATRSARVLIVGGGIGGLTAAVGLQQAGFDVTVYERAEGMQTAQVGRAFIMWNNAMRVLTELGIADQVHAAGSTPIEWFENRKANGDVVIRWPVGELSRRLGLPHPVGIKRSALHGILSSAVYDGTIQYMSECAGFEQDSEGVTVRFKDGKEVRGHVLIAADGSRSNLRAQLFGAHSPRYVGATMWNAIVPFDHEITRVGAFRELQAPRVRFKTFPVSEDEVYWTYATKMPVGGSDPEGGMKTELLRRTERFMEPAQALVEAAHSVNRVDVAGGTPAEVWVKGRVALMGDAAHATTPWLGQGAAQSMEDALVLMRSLRDHRDDLEAGLRAYEARRKPRATKIMLRSYNLAKRSMVGGPGYKIGSFMLKRMSSSAFKQHERDMTYQF
jgi:FAD-dependent urate hydroxylase